MHRVPLLHHGGIARNTAAIKSVGKCSFSKDDVVLKTDPIGVRDQLSNVIHDIVLSWLPEKIRRAESYPRALPCLARNLELENAPLPKKMLSPGAFSMPGGSPF